MGRSARQDLDYFPMDVYFDQDDKIKLIETEFGNQATTIYFKLLARIYREKGYWKKWDVDTEMLFARDINEKHGYVREVIQGCLRRGLFDESVFELFSVLTSASIQKRYIDIVNQLGRRDVVVVSEYWVYDKPLERFSRISPDVISISSDEKSVSSGENDLKRKEKKKKGNKTTYVGPDGSDAYPDVCEFLDEARELAQHLLARIIEWKPDHKYARGDPSLHSWILAIERMIRLDGRKPKHIRYVIDYTFTASTKQAQFWAKNVWSGGKLRDQYDRMVEDYKDEKEARENGKQPNNGTGESRTDRYYRLGEEVLGEFPE